MPHRPPLTGLDKLTLTEFVGLLAATVWKILSSAGWSRPRSRRPSQVGDFASTVLLLADATGAIGAMATTVQRSRTPPATTTSP